MIYFALQGNSFCFLCLIRLCSPLSLPLPEVTVVHLTCPEPSWPLSTAHKHHVIIQKREEQGGKGKCTLGCGAQGLMQNTVNIHALQAGHCLPQEGLKHQTLENRALEGSSLPKLSPCVMLLPLVPHHKISPQSPSR